MLLANTEARARVVAGDASEILAPVLSTSPSATGGGVCCLSWIASPTMRTSFNESRSTPETASDDNGTRFDAQPNTAAMHSSALGAAVKQNGRNVSPNG